MNKIQVMLIAKASAVAAMAIALPAAADSYVTDVFHGTVAATAADGFSPPTTNDFADTFGFYPSGPFGGGNLIGSAFTLTTTVDVSAIGGASSFTGSTGYQGGYPYGGYYGCCSPMTAKLTINGQSIVFDDHTGVLPIFFNISTDGAKSPNQLQEQAFYWSQSGGGTQYMGLDLVLNSAKPVFGSDFTTQLPPLSANTDFTVGYAAFYTSAGEYQNLDILSVYGAVPEPATWTMMILGVAMVGFTGRRRREAMALAA